MSDAVWLDVDRFATVLGIVTGLLSLFAAGWAWWKKNDLKRWWRRNSFGRVGQVVDTSADASQQFDALLLPISKPDVPCWLIDTLRPVRIALIATPQSQAAAQQVEAYARAANVGIAASLTLPDANDTAAFREHAARLIRQLREAGAVRIAVDSTGGKVPMSLGLFMAAEEAGVTTIYVSTHFDAPLKRPRLESARLITLTSPTP
jgi:hypothetical protein